VEQILFPFAQYWWAYAGFVTLVLGLLALDLGVFHRHAHAVTLREAAAWSGFWVALALLFNVGLYLYARHAFAIDPELLATPGFDPGAAASRVGLEFLAGLIVEKALAVDNIFVFVVVFGYFGVPAVFQHRVLFYGILGALVFRALFIAAGSVLLQYHWVVVVFGALLLLTAVKMVMASNVPVQPDRNVVIRLLRRVVPVTPELHGHRFFVRLAGRLHVTPLLVALLALEMSDIIFAIDSVPAIFALTREPLIVFTSNMFAILGLRAMYFLLAGAVEKFHLLKYGLALVLAFVGLKMVWLNDVFDGHFPITWSLVIITTVVGTSIAASLLLPGRAPVQRGASRLPVTPPRPGLPPSQELARWVGDGRLGTAPAESPGTRSGSL
jgi:tellurite resistance protein TerC